MPESLFEAGLSRRNLLKFGGLTAAGVSALTLPQALGAAPAHAAPAAQWPGHVPGKVFLGACAHGFDSTVARTGALGLQRAFFRWNDGSREDKVIKANHAAGRLPWVSFKPPVSSGGWAAVASGQYDADIRARAQRYAALSGPVIVTFNHEPQTDKAAGTPAEFVKAWIRIHDVMKSATGLKNVASAPIIGEWVFNPINKQHNPEDYVTGPMLDRAHFLGLDVYQTKNGATYDSRLGNVFDYMDAKGHTTKMVGIGETGATNSYGSPSGAAWWTSSWAFATANANRVGAIAYFNSLAHNNSGNNWLLWESQAKLDAFKASLRSPGLAAKIGASPATSATTTSSTPSRETAASVSRSSVRPAPAETEQHRWGSRWVRAI